MSINKPGVLFLTKCISAILELTLTFEDCNWKLWMKEQKQLKNQVRNRVRNHGIHIKHICDPLLLRTQRSLAAWPALARWCCRIFIRSPPTSQGISVNVRTKARAPRAPRSARSARASKRFVSTSWVEVVLAGGVVFGLCFDAQCNHLYHQYQCFQITST